MAVASKWALEKIGVDGEARVYELGPNGFSLRYLVDWGTARLLGDRLWIEHGGEVTLLELATGVQTRLGRARFVAQTPDDLYVIDADLLRRLRRSDLAELGRVPWVPAQDASSNVAILRDGASLLADGALVSFTRGKVVRQSLGAGTVRPDGARLLACDQDAATLVEIDAESGAATATFSGQQIGCTRDTPRTTTAAYAADPRYVFWAEHQTPRPPRGAPAVVVAVGDTRDGSVTRTVDRAHSWEGAPWAEARFDAAHGRLCLGFWLMTVGWERCEWELAPSGRAVPSPRSVPSPPGFVRGATLLAQATSPSGGRTAVLLERPLPGGARELAVASATAGKVDRKTVVASGKLPWDPLRGDDYKRVGTWPVGLFFFDERHIAILPNSDGVPPPAYIDVDTGAVQRLCTEEWVDDCKPTGGVLAGRDRDEPYDVSFASGRPQVHPRWIHIRSAGSLLDGTTGQTYPLKPSDAEWAHATRIVPACP